MQFVQEWTEASTFIIITPLLSPLYMQLDFYLL